MAHQYTCTVCGEAVLPVGRYSKYCNNSCKQKAYRNKKAAQAKAKEMTLDMEHYQSSIRLIDFSPRLESHMIHFLEKYGKTAYYDAIEFANMLMDDYARMLEDNGARFMSGN